MDMNRIADPRMAQALRRILTTTRAQWWPSAVPAPGERSTARLSDTLWHAHGQRGTPRVSPWRHAA